MTFVPPRPNVSAVSTAILTPATSVGTILASLSDPFAGLGLGTTAYATFGTVPGQLVLSGSNIVLGASAVSIGATYATGLLAISGDGSQATGRALGFSTQALFTALGTSGSLVGALNANSGFAPVFTPSLSGDIDQLATTGTGSSASLVIGPVPSYAHVINGTLNLGNGPVPLAVTVNPAPTVAATLPSLPLPLGTKGLGHGDSYTGFNNIISGGQVAAAAATEKGLVEAALQADPRFNFDSWSGPDPWERNVLNGGVAINGANQGIPADHFVLATTSNLTGGGITRRIAYSIARQPGFVILNSMGTNTISTGDLTGISTPPSAGYVTGQIDVMISQFITAGIYVVLQTLYPRGDWPSGDARHQILRDVNTWIRAQSGRTGVLGIVDPYNLLVSSGDPDGVKSQYYLEGVGGVHLNSAGVALVQPLLTAILASAIAPGSVFDQLAANSNLDASYGLLGTAGTKTGAQSTGVVATGCTLYMARSGGGSTQVGSKDTTSGTYNKQVVTVTAGSTGAWDQSRLTLPTITSSLPAAGQWVRGYVFIETASGSPAANMVLTVNVLDSSSNILVSALAGVIDSNQYTSATLGVNVASGRGGYWLQTKPFVIPAGSTPASITRTIVANFWTGGYAAPFSYKASSPIVRVVSDPRPAWLLP